MKRIGLLALAMLALSPPVLAQQASPADVLQAVVEGYIRPETEAFREQADGLAETLGTLCTTPSAANLQDARTAFADAATGYGRTEFLRIGPLVADNRADRLLFWPDRRGIGLRQVQQILAEKDASATELAGLSEKSVAVQGLGALEFVLFGTDAEQLSGTEGAFRCAYGQAIAQNVALIAGEIADAWADPEGIALRLTEPDPANADFRTTTESLETVVGLLSHGLEAVRDTRINAFIGAPDTAPMPKQALFWRSGLTMAMIKANLDGIEGMTDAARLDEAIPPDVVGLANSIAFEFTNVHRAVDLVTEPVEQAVADAGQVQALRYLVIVTGSLQSLIGEQLSTALGLSVGFSSMDGD